MQQLHKVLYAGRVGALVDLDVRQDLKELCRGHLVAHGAHHSLQLRVRWRPSVISLIGLTQEEQGAAGARTSSMSKLPRPSMSNGFKKSRSSDSVGTSCAEPSTPASSRVRK